MTDEERTMREERWMLSNELFLPERPEPPEVAAFRLLQEDDWMHFLMNVQDNDALKFFNAEQRDFDSARDWLELSERRGIKPFDNTMAIPQTIPVEAQDFCRELRMEMRQRGDTYTGGCITFNDPFEFTGDRGGPGCVLMVCHDGCCAAPWFNPSYEQLDKYDRVDQLLKLRGLWREGINPAVTAIYHDRV